MGGSAKTFLFIIKKKKSFHHFKRLLLLPGSGRDDPGWRAPPVPRTASTQKAAAVPDLLSWTAAPTSAQTLRSKLQQTARTPRCKTSRKTNLSTAAASSQRASFHLVYQRLPTSFPVPFQTCECGSVHPTIPKLIRCTVAQKESWRSVTLQEAVYTE